MFVKVSLYGTLRRLSSAGEMGHWQGNIPEGSSIIELIAILGTKPEEVAAGCINNKVCPLETVIPENAKVILVTHVAGG